MFHNNNNNNNTSSEREEEEEGKEEERKGSKKTQKMRRKERVSNNNKKFKVWFLPHLQFWEEEAEEAADIDNCLGSTEKQKAKKANVGSALFDHRERKRRLCWVGGTG